MTIWVRFQQDGRERTGTLEGGHVQPRSGSLLDGGEAEGEAVALDQVRLLAPVRPRSFFALWNNFHEAAAKNGWTIPSAPLWFLKAPGCVAGPGDPIRPPPGYGGRVLYEGELGVVIGQRCSRVDEAGAETAIFGYTVVNDVTALDWLNEDPAFAQWARAKSCDGFGPVGPGVATGFDWRAARVKVALNGRVRQDYALSDMILSPARIVSLLSQEVTLEPGDLIACGTSLGALPMRPGMTVEVTIEGIGTLRNVFAPP